GAASGSTTVDDFGLFDCYEPTSTLGTVHAHATGNDPSDFVMSDVAVTAPQVSALTIVYGSQKNRTVTISGSVVAPFNQSMAVNFSGVISGSASTNALGQFTLTANASGPGNVNVKATD